MHAIFLKIGFLCAHVFSELQRKIKPKPVKAISVRPLPGALHWGDCSSVRTESPRGSSPFFYPTTAHQRFEGNYCSFHCIALTPGQTFAVSTVPHKAGFSPQPSFFGHVPVCQCCS